MNEPITVSVSIDAAALLEAVNSKRATIIAGLTETEVFELIEASQKYYRALDEIRKMTGCGADQIAARALGRSV